MKPDAETKEVITEAEQMLSLVQSEGWRIAKAKLDEKILDLQNIHNIDTADTSKMLVEILGRKLAVEILFNWVKSDIYGFVQQQIDNNAPAAAAPAGEEIIDLGNK